MANEFYSFAFLFLEQFQHKKNKKIIIFLKDYKTFNIKISYEELRF